MGNLRVCLSVNLVSQVPAWWSVGKMEYVVRAITFTVFFSVQNYLLIMK